MNKLHKEQPEQYQLYNDTFPSYNDAFNHACDNSIPTHMILSSKHPSMTNERLQYLEREYTFSKMQMSIEDKREYFDYLSNCPHSLDQQNRYHKLKTWIERYEYQQESIRQRKEEDMIITKEAYKLLGKMQSNGLVIEYDGDNLSSKTKYILKGKVLHTWYSGGKGLSSKEYYNMIKTIHDNHFHSITK